MGKSGFIEFRTPSNLSEDEMDEIINENNFKTVGDLMADVEFDVWKHLIDTGEIFDNSISDLFFGLDDEATINLIERINEIVPTNYSKKEKPFLENMNKWLYDYKKFCSIQKFKKKNLPTISTKQQLLLIYYLQKAKLFNLNKIHQDQTKQAHLLAMMLCKGYENIYKDLKKVTSSKYEEEFDKILYLQPIYDLFTLLGINEIANEIEQKIKLLQEKIKK